MGMHSAYTPTLKHVCSCISFYFALVFTVYNTAAYVSVVQQNLVDLGVAQIL